MTRPMSSRSCRWGPTPTTSNLRPRRSTRSVNADALIVNGAGFEEGLLDVIDSARDEGVPTYEAIDAVETIEFGEGIHSAEHDGEEMRRRGGARARA